MNILSKDPTTDQLRQPKRRGKQPTYHDYCALIRRTFGFPKRDIFTGQLVVLINGTYRNILEPEVLGKLRSICRDTPGYSASSLEDHIFRLTGELKSEFLPLIPAWDGTDRISQIASMMSVKNCLSEHVEQFIKEWGSLMFLRLYNPAIQNRCIVLIGSQGIGKDHLVATLVGGLGNYLRELTIVKYMDEADLGLILTSALCVQISEFDRTSYLETGTLKSILTKEYSDFRPKYGRAIVRHVHRCSFIATCNQRHIFRDFTGNRRFVVMELDGGPGQAINWKYPSTDADRLQILAQFKYLAAQNYHASKEANDSMRLYIESMTPENPEEAVMQEFDERLMELKRQQMKADTMFTNFEINKEKIFEELSRAYGMGTNRIRHLATSTGRAWRTSSHRGFKALLEEECSDE